MSLLEQYLEKARTISEAKDSSCSKEKAIDTSVSPTKIAAKIKRKSKNVGQAMAMAAKICGDDKETCDAVKEELKSLFQNR